jgi:hypothetical protein
MAASTVLSTILRGAQARAPPATTAKPLREDDVGVVGGIGARHPSVIAVQKTQCRFKNPPRQYAMIRQ